LRFIRFCDVGAISNMHFAIEIRCDDGKNKSDNNYLYTNAKNNCSGIRKKM
jgi:hypothetical protein